MAEFEMSYSISNAREFVATMRALAARSPATRDELKALETDCVSVALKLQHARELAVGIPEVVWHFLSDADIRFKDPEYAIAQLAGLRSALEQIESESAI